MKILNQSCCFPCFLGMQFCGRHRGNAGGPWSDYGHDGRLKPPTKRRERLEDGQLSPQSTNQLQHAATAQDQSTGGTERE